MLDLTTGQIKQLVGGFLILATLGTVYSYGNLAPYIVSYLRQHGNPDLRYKDASWIYTGHMIGMSIGMAMGGSLLARLGARNAAWAGCFFMAACVMVTYYTADTFLGVFLTYGLMFGIGLGAAYSAPMVIAHRWLPDRKGFAAGFLMSGYGLGSSVFNIFQVGYVNPENLVPTHAPYADNPREVFFDNQDLLDRVPIFYIRLGLVYLVCQIVGGLLLEDNPPPNALPPSAVAALKAQQAAGNGPAKQAASAWWVVNLRQFWLLWGSMFTIALAVGFSTSYWKVIGQSLVWAHDWDLAKVGAALCAANAGGRLFWGYTADKMKSSRRALAYVALWASLSLATLPYVASLQNVFLFGVWMVLIFFAIGGSYALFPGVCTEAFGTSQFAAIYGLAYSSQGFSVLLGAVIHSLVIPLVGLAAMPLLVSGACAVAFVFMLNYPDEPVTPPADIFGDADDMLHEDANCEHEPLAPKEVELVELAQEPTPRSYGRARGAASNSFLEE